MPCRPVPRPAGDDCCKGFDFLWELAWVFDTIKRLDPYHLTAGFAECGELHAFQEPHLSLDAPIRENYRPEMAFHHNDGSAAHPGSDASLRMPPNTFEPVFNGLQAERQAVPVCPPGSCLLPPASLCACLLCSLACFNGSIGVLSNVA
jgi:hypothetical protein